MAVEIKHVFVKLSTPISCLYIDLFKSNIEKFGFSLFISGMFCGLCMLPEPRRL